MNKKLADIFQTIGLLVLFAVLAAYLPISVPGLLGYQSYEITSGSMEPEIPTGALVYVRSVPGEMVEPDDVVTFRFPGSTEAVTHRVVTQERAGRQLVTKGDANSTTDLRPVPYDCVMGRVAFSLPYWGYLSHVITDSYGKLSMGAALLASALLLFLGSSLRGKKKKNKSGAVPLINALLLLFLTVAGLAAWRLIDRQRAYKESDAEYEGLREHVSVSEEGAAVRLKAGADTAVPEEEEFDWGADPYGWNDGYVAEPYFPWDVEWPEVDFDALAAQNPDFLGWLYIDGTVINYPVVLGPDNKYYEELSFNYVNCAAGCMFMDCRDPRDMSALHSIIYGHHMTDGSMMQNIVKYKQQEFFEEHPYGLFMTPEQNYVIQFFAGDIRDVESDAWQTTFVTRQEYKDWIDHAIADSVIDTGIVPNSHDQILTLSTCSYEFYEARFVLHGILRPEPKAETEQTA